MARVLRRPMFRLGGNTDQGIMSGVAPRQGYAAAGSVEDMERRKEILRAGVGKTPDRSGYDFAIDWGLGMVSGTPKGNILATAAEQAKEPLQKFRQAKAEERSFERQIGLTAATSSMEQMDELERLALKNMSKSDLSAIGKLAEEAVENGKYPDYQTAWKEIFRLKLEESKQWSKPDWVKRQESVEDNIEFITKRDDISPKEAGPIAEKIEQAIEGKFDAEGAKPEDEISGRLDRNQMYIIETDIGERQGDDSYKIVINNPEGTYNHDEVYYNPKDQQFYVYNSSTNQFHIVTLPGQGAVTKTSSNITPSNIIDKDPYEDPFNIDEEKDIYFDSDEEQKSLTNTFNNPLENLPIENRRYD